MKLASVFHQYSEVLTILGSNAECGGTGATSKHVIDTLKKDISRKENNTAQLIVKLDTMVCALQTNRVESTRTARLHIRALYIASIGLWIALSCFVHDQSKVTRYTSIGSRASAAIGVITDILIFVFGERWGFKLKTTKNTSKNIPSSPVQ